MKKYLNIKNILICIAFTIFLLFIKDNIGVVWDIICIIAAVLTPFVIGFLIAYILNFPYRFFYSAVFGKMGTKRKKPDKLRKPLSIVCTYLLVLLILGLLVAVLIPQIAGNIASLVQKTPNYITSLSNDLNGAVEWVNKTFNTEFDLYDFFNGISDKLLSYFTADNITKLSTRLYDTFVPFITSTAQGIYNFVMGVIISVYLLAEKDKLCRQVKKLAVAFIPIKWLPKVYETIDITDTKCGRFLIGDIIDAALVGVLVFIIMSLFSLPYAALIAVLVGVTNLIPFFGPYIGAIPSAFILLLENPWDMVIFLIIIFVIQQFDGNLFKPKIIGNQVGLSSFWVLFSVIVGGALFGLPGFILGTPIYAVIYSLVKKRVRNSIDEKGKIALEALDFEVLNYTKIAEEQKKLREEKETAQKEKLRRLIKRDAIKNGDSQNGESDENRRGGKAEDSDKNKKK